MVFLAVIWSYGREYCAHGETVEAAMTNLSEQDEDFDITDMSFYSAEKLAVRAENHPRIVPIT